MDKLVNREKAKLREVLMSENVKANQRERENERQSNGGRQRNRERGGKLLNE